MESSNFLKFHSRGAREQFFSKTPLLNNFLTVWPIFTSDTLVDSGKQGKQNEIIKFSKFHSRGAREQFSWKTPLLNNFLTVWRICLQSTYRSIQVDKEKMSIIQKRPNFTLGEKQVILFVKNTPKITLTNEPIFTNYIPIDWAWQAKTHRNFKNF
jgi:hypothetical protein